MGYIINQLIQMVNPRTIPVKTAADFCQKISVD